MSLKVSQIWGWASHNDGGSVKRLQYALGGLIITHLSLWYAPLGRTLGGGLMKTFHRLYFSRAVLKYG